MTLAEVVRDLDHFPREHTIYVAADEGQWYAGSRAFVTEEPEDGDLTQTFEGVPMRYFLEVFLARDAVEVYQEHHHTPTQEEKLRAIIYYVEHDSYLPPPGGWR